MLSTKEIIKKYIPNGIQNIKGKGDGKPQYLAEIEIIEKCINEYTKQLTIKQFLWLKIIALKNKLTKLFSF